MYHCFNIIDEKQILYALKYSSNIAVHNKTSEAQGVSAAEIEYLRYIITPIDLCLGQGGTSISSEPSLYQPLKYL